MSIRTKSLRNQGVNGQDAGGEVNGPPAGAISSLTDPTGEIDRHFRLCCRG